MIPVGYNMALNLYDGVTKDDIAEFVDNRNLGKEFADWSAKYFRAVNKFDAIKEDKDD